MYLIISVAIKVSKKLLACYFWATLLVLLCPQIIYTTT